MKKISVEASLEKYNALAIEIAGLQQLAETSANKLADMEANADLQDDAAITAINRLQALNSLLPNRITAREKAFQQAETDLLAVCNDYISSTHGPKSRELTARAEAKTESALKPYISDLHSLRTAISNAELVIEARSFSISTQSNPLFGVVRFAEEIIGLAKRVAAFEAKLS